MATRIGLLMVFGFILATITNCTIPFAVASGWTDQHLESGGVRLTYPSVMSEDDAQDFLEDRERALEFAEEFLQTRLGQPLEITVNVSLLTTSGTVWPLRSLTVMYNLPFLHLQSSKWQARRGLAVHEIIHVVDLYQWALAANLALREGLAVAGDVTARPSVLVDSHLVCKGLLIENALIPLGALLAMNDRLSLTFAENQMIFYQESASFVQFLIAQYGLSRFRKFYKDSYLPVAFLQEKARQAYGKNLSSLEEEWLRFLRGYVPGEELRAQHIAEALRTVDTRICMPLEQLESYWKRASFVLVSPSEKVQRELDTFFDSMTTLGRPSHNKGNADATAEALNAYNYAAAELDASLSRWLEAIRTFRAFLSLLPVRSDYGVINNEIEEIQALYREVGDEGMVTRTGEYITAFQLLQKGEFALMNGDHVLTENLLSRALGLFLKLDEQQMAHQVSRRLEFSRRVIMQ